MVQTMIRLNRWPMVLALVGFAAVSCVACLARADGSFDASNPNQPNRDAAAVAANSASANSTGFPATSGFGVPNGGAPAGRDGKSATPARGAPRIEGGQVNGHWREGTRLIDQLGRFKIAGDRLTFTSNDGSLHFDCLENLCGQRVARTVTDSPEPLLWTVTGELTEYRGTNFLLLTQAVLKSRPRRSIHAP